ncbi:HAMP domain-containing histidine kinase [Alteromonas sp. ALT199]|uniref:sensor histidine kinase n=1 Tax=unclassified Alteromonas TaxID=2614992 RepID=UPI00044CA7F9|nr:ATP-binding protein [Alteromonas sp. ALT199]MBT3135703.1 HAMP domain-containing histidine kinase [Alteromonas sp. ALT199]
MFEQLVGKLPVGIGIVDEDFNVVYLNDFFLDRLPHNMRSCYKETPVVELFQGQGKFLKRRLKSVFVLQHPSFSYWEQRPHIFPFKSSRPITGEETQMYQNMEILPIKDKTTGQRLACIFLQDVTAQASYFRAQQKLSEALKKEHEAQRKLIRKLDTAQSQLIQAEKMASTGQLAAGIAHEINNPIGFVNANLNTLEQYASHLLAICDGVKTQLEHFTDDLKEQISVLFESNHYDLLKDDITELITESTDGLTRVKDIVENLKNFSLETTEGTQVVDICAVCHQLITLISAQYSSPQYKLQCEHEKVEVMGNPGPLKQALMNVMINAAQAIEEKGFIKLTVIDAAQSVTIKILDSGCGIPVKNLKRVFEPFFTTKPEGQGQGLGLSVAYTAIEQHQGKISISSKEAKGTVVEITIPKQSTAAASCCEESEVENSQAT